MTVSRQICFHVEILRLFVEYGERSLYEDMRQRNRADASRRMSGENQHKTFLIAFSLHHNAKRNYKLYHTIYLQGSNINGSS